MESRLLIIADLGRVKAYKLDYTLYNTPRLELLEEIPLEEAHNRLLDKVTDEAGCHGSPTQKNWGVPLADDHNLQLEFKTAAHPPDFRPHPSGSSSAAVVTSAGWLHRRRSTRRFLKIFLWLSASDCSIN
jgi:hypothetical protein